MDAGRKGPRVCMGRTERIRVDVKEEVQTGCSGNIIVDEEDEDQI